MITPIFDATVDAIMEGFGEKKNPIKSYIDIQNYKHQQTNSNDAAQTNRSSDDRQQTSDYDELISQKVKEQIERDRKKNGG